MSNKFIPGPWIVDPDNGFNGVVGRGGQQVLLESFPTSLGNSGDPSLKGNTELALAAPELLEALELANELNGILRAFLGPDDCQSDLLDKSMKDSKALIDRIK